MEITTTPPHLSLETMKVIPAAVGRRSRLRRWRPVLPLAFLFAACYALTQAIFLDPLLARRYSPAPPAPKHPETDYGRQFVHDPAIGSELPRTGAGNPLRRMTGDQSKGFLLVPVGDCVSCLATDLQAWEKQCRQHNLKLILLTTSPPETARSFRTKLGIKVPIAIDAKSGLLKGLNPLWLARPYLYTPDWRLVWVSHEHHAFYSPFDDKTFAALTEGAKIEIKP